MITPAAMLRKLQALNLEEEAGLIIDQNLSELADLNKEQLMQGKNNKGQLLSPKHSENPWFKSVESALKYAAWKHRLFPETPFDVPNLTITGVYHGSIFFRRTGNTVTADASAPFAASIDATFNNSPLGLNDESKETAWTTIIRRPLVHNVANKLGVSVIT